MTAFYNEIDPYCAQWLRNLIDADLIAPGIVDERSIEDIRPSDLDGFTQCHFFAGIGVWSYALRLAGVPDEFPVWTGSCPCQPFSVAAVAWERKHFEDERHLWPAWRKLVMAKQPSIVLGEQVANGGIAWFDLVSNELEESGYAVGSAILPARCVGIPHIRYRNFFCAYSMRAGRPGHQYEQRFPQSARTTQPVAGHEAARIRCALEGDYVDLLRGDDASVAVERCATKGYGNAIVAHVAKEFIAAAFSAKP